MTGSSGFACPGHGGSGHGGSGEVGHELRLLALALLDRYEPGVRSVLAGLQVEAAEAASGVAGSGAASTTGSGVPATCTWCPLCNLVGLARGDRPELAGRLAEQAGALLVTLRAVLQEAPGPAGSDDTGRRGPDPGSVSEEGAGSAAGSSADPDRAGGAGGASGGSPRVERIEVRPAGGGC